MNPEKKKHSSSESKSKNSHSKSMKSSKSSSKSRVKTSKSDSNKTNTNGHTPSSTSQTSGSETPTTPTSSSDSSRERSHHKGYAAFSPRTIKIIWEQHDTSDTHLNPEILPILAEDVSYKMWELVKNIKTYSIHSGGAVTSDLVNEVLKDCDCPPVLGSMDSYWDRIDYDGSFFFHSDEVIELRNEYQKNVQVTMPVGPPFTSAWPIQGGCRELIQSLMQSIFLITLGGSETDFDSVRQYVYSTPFIGGCYRVLLQKMIQTLAFKQTNHVKLRCWHLMQTFAQHPSCRNVCSREEYFHLAEIFICQLLNTYEACKVKYEIPEDEEVKISQMETDEVMPQQEEIVQIKLEDIKEEDIVDLVEDKPKEITVEEEVKEEFIPVEEESQPAEPIYRLEMDDGEDESTAEQMEGIEYSPYFADKVDLELVDDLCETIGLIGAINEFFNTDCMHLILRRLEIFFVEKKTFSPSDYEFISRAIRGLFALGEYAFREFIPFMERMDILEAEYIPHSLTLEFARCAIFLRGHDDIFLYEWLNELCSNKLQPFMTHYAHFHQKLITHRHLKRKVATFKIIAKVSAKRMVIPSSSKSPLEKKKIPIEKYFPDLAIPNKSHSPIRFKFKSGGRQLPVKVKPSYNITSDTSGTKPADSLKEILIARRKLYKPLTDEKTSFHLSNYHLLRI